MSILATCPSCSHTQQASEKLAGKSVKCQKCQGSMVVPAGAESANTTRSAPGSTKEVLETSESTGAITTVFLLGLGALLAGCTGGILSFFRATTDYSAPIVWTGIFMGFTALIISILKEETGFVLPYVGSLLSLLMLGLMTSGIAAPMQETGWPGGGPPGFQPGGNAPGDWKGGPPPGWKGGPPPGDWKGAPPR